MWCAAIAPFDWLTIADRVAYGPGMSIEPTVILALTATAVLTGFIDSIAGGGGLVMMPALLFAGVPPINALATNKLQSMFGTLVATWNYWRKGLVRVREHGLTLMLILAGAAAGVVLVQRVSNDLLKLAIPVLLMVLALYVLLSPRMADNDAHQRVSQRGYAPIGGALGFYDGFFGPGVGSFYTTTLVALRGMGLTRATAVTKLYNVTSNIAAVVVFAIGGKMLWTLGMCMALGSMTGGYLGSHTAIRFGASVIRPLLVILSLALTVRLLWSYFIGR